MRMSDLPRDLKEEILSRVPATSLKRLLSTCKLWNGLLKDTGFREKHLRKARKQSLVLMLKEGMISSVNVNLNLAPPSIEFTGTLGLTESHSKSEQVDIFRVIEQCDGLLLCCTNDDRLVVWNPCLGETKWIQLKSGHSKYSSFVLGYQKNKTCHSYKILKWESWQINEQFEIYDFCSSSWRVVNQVKHDYTIRPMGVSLKGDSYLIAQACETDGKFVLRFDFTTESLKHLRLPAVSRLLYFSLVGEEQLSLFDQTHDLSNLRMWVTKKIDTEAALSWSICFTVDVNTPGIIRPVICSSLLIDEEKKVAVYCFKDDESKIYTVTVGGDYKYYREIPTPVVKSTLWPSIFSYVPSLVQV